MKKLNILDFKSNIESLVDNLAAEEYGIIERYKQNGIIPIVDLINRINEYGEEIVALPENWIKDALVYDIEDKRLDVYLPLWTNFGKSDLTLSLSCFYIHNRPHIEISDLEVL